MSPIHRPAGIFLLFSAFVLLLVASVSTPFFQPVDIVHTTQSINTNSERGTEEVRYGIWGACRTATGSSTITVCQHLGHGYSTTNNPLLAFFDLNSEDTKFTGVNSSWTKGLPVHVVAAIIVFISFVCSFLTKPLITILVAGIGAVVTLIAIAIDIAFNILTRHAVDEITNSASTSFGPGFWLTLVAFVITIGGSVLLFLHRREDDAWDSEAFSLDFIKKPLSRFKN
ncbi:hypothetical protein Clacol_003459 [Clathrus columnatus]|uniref:Pali-domain-containing protein n=1 Tax=Clathrus columnatus TaxID=1419009 RepID=A0AAV5A6V5_9AGAM|nr:hypothetical protein Clacol_003459 [Clathrus columnatus]